MEVTSEARPVRNDPKRNLRTLLPLVLFLGVAIFLGIGLTLDPRKIPSPLIRRTQ